MKSIAVPGLGKVGSLAADLLAESGPAGGTRTAIARTTASSVVAVIEMTRDGALPGRGFLKQEHIPRTAFLATRTGSAHDSGAVR